MYEIGMYVRCPLDLNQENSRNFAIGQIFSVDPDEGTVMVHFHDPDNYRAYYGDYIPKIQEFSTQYIMRSTFFPGSKVRDRDNHTYKVLQEEAGDPFKRYLLRNEDTEEVTELSEKQLIAAFNNGQVDPYIQMKRYEFSNPYFFTGREKVLSGLNLLDQAMFGYRNIAGAKINLLPHQLKAVMRMTAYPIVRYMLADEVGMGKTIEALSVLRVYQDKYKHRKTIIIVPDPLKEQWRVEMLMKFGLAPGEDPATKNTIELLSFSEFASSGNETADFVIVDEVHRIIEQKPLYDKLKRVAGNCTNLLLLSATPIRHKPEQYLNLLRLLEPGQYEAMSLEQFEQRLSQQGRIIQKTSSLVDDLDDLQTLVEDNEDPEEIEEVAEDIEEAIEDIAEFVGDEYLASLQKSDDAEQLIRTAQNAVAYISETYQIEKNMIKNRRRLLERDEFDDVTLATRHLITESYDFDDNVSRGEREAYDILTNWVQNLDSLSLEETESYVYPIIRSFFSSPWAYEETLKESQWLKSQPEKQQELLLNSAQEWVNQENSLLDQFPELFKDWNKLEQYSNSRIVKVMRFLLEQLGDSKALVITDFPATFKNYRKALEMLLEEEEIAFFDSTLPQEVVEQNSFKFQNSNDCQIMLSDESGGEGRNFQCASYLLHVDLPWNAGKIEQRIGRLDRLERAPDQKDIYSVVFTTTDTIEESMLSFWSEGLGIFEHSLSGLEIIMDEIDRQLYESVQDNLKNGLFTRIPVLQKATNKAIAQIGKEQLFDLAALIYQPQYRELENNLHIYKTHEKEIFHRIFSGWAPRAGFAMHQAGEGKFKCSPYSFSIQSAINTLFIPPQWQEYWNRPDNKLQLSLQQKNNSNQEKAIIGTYRRDIALKNDYIHLFAPGDAVFDTVVENAVSSSKGQAAAVMIPGPFNWKGFVFNWSFYPDQTALVQQGVPVEALNDYRSSLPTKARPYLYTIEGDDEITETQVLQVYSQWISSDRLSKQIHLGKRTQNGPLEWFKEEYPKKDWINLLTEARKETYKKATQYIQRASNIGRIRSEIEQRTAARMARDRYYGMTEDSEQEETRQKLIWEAYKKPKRKLQSILYLEVKKSDE